MAEAASLRVGPGSRSSAASLTDDAVASLALAAFSVAVAVGYARVFSGWDFLDEMIVLVVAAHGSSLVLRRLRVNGWIAVPATAAVTVWTIGMIQYRSTFSWWLPTADTWALVESELQLVRDQFSVAVAPVIYGSGWDVLAAVGLALAVVLSDAFAFRAFARAEALVPGGVLFVFVGALGTDRLRVASTVLLVVAGVGATIALRWYHAPTTAAGQRSTLGFAAPAAVTVTIVIALTAGLVGPRLPGADAAPVYETRGGGGSSSTMVSPLVDIRSRLTNRENVQLFVVDANLESYWRSSALPRFDGTTWGLADRDLAPADPALAGRRPGAEDLFQQVRVVNLSGSLVPAAPDPFQASGAEELRWMPETSTLRTVGDDLERGDTFQIVSASPRFDPAQLAGATATDAGDPIHLELPDDLPDVVAETARTVTAGAPDAYTTALALQDWFQDEFTYSLEVQPGHGNSAIEGFLRDRVGYCEQFSGTYAAMMRTLGIPARVAVGFTSGNQVNPDTYSVLGRHAHAWPEVWFDGIGWVPFEPTPGRGAPGAEAYTGIAPQQDSGTSPDDPTDDPGDESTTPTTTLPDGAPPEDGPLNLPQEDLRDPGAGATDEEAVTPDDGNRTWVLVSGAVLALVGLVAPWMLRRSRDRRARASVDRQLARCWNQALEALEVVGVPRSAERTPFEAAALTAERFPIAARPISSLAAVVTEATYSQRGTEGFDVAGSYGASTMRDCRNWCRQIERAVNDSVPFGTRVRRYFRSG